MKLSIDTCALSQRAILLTLAGELDYVSAQHLRTAVTEAITGDIHEIVISLADVTFVDSTGIGTLVVARRICGDMRVNLRVRDASPFIARLFAVVGVAEALGLPQDGAWAVVPKPRLDKATQPA
ncbi:MAG: STAS domain-containing protein [Dactylosporangium sp.]|nr:STAS domain-containing protein [Dactylosporangium sp.]NNJ62557.1 STAS domain-containing protein [Dactylosporangium sp.]